MMKTILEKINESAENIESTEIKIKNGKTLKSNFLVTWETLRARLEKLGAKPQKSIYLWGSFEYELTPEIYNLPEIIKKVRIYKIHEGGYFNPGFVESDTLMFSFYANDNNVYLITPSYKIVYRDCEVPKPRYDDERGFINYEDVIINKDEWDKFVDNNILGSGYNLRERCKNLDEIKNAASDIIKKLAFK